MISCRELVDFLMDYVDNDLGNRERKRFDEHLDACPECVDYVESYKSTIDLGQGVCNDDVSPEDMPEDLVKAILDARQAGL